MDLVLDVIRTYGRPRRVLDIGCGEGVGTDPALFQRVVAESDEFWGVEPDTSIEPRPGVFSNFQHALFEDAEIPDESIDVAYSCMVMEHVQNPEGFMAKAFRVLKPGGTYIFLTVNGAHYFARIANAMRALRVDETVLRAVRSEAVVEGYHYPTAYKFNRPRQIAAVCSRLGFEAPRYVFAEHEGARCYFPGPTVAAWHLFTLKRRLLRNPRLLLELICAIRKPE
jgi:ubiquinone/menaquinone biosynthesis C-methylase UbiE